MVPHLPGWSGIGVCVYVDGDGYTHRAKVRWVSMCGGIAWAVPTHRVPQVPLTILLSTDTHAHTYTLKLSPHPCGTNILTETGRRRGVSTLSNWATTGVGPAQHRMVSVCPQRTRRKPQLLLESISCPPPPNPIPTTLEANSNTEPSDGGAQRTADSLHYIVAKRKK